MKWQDLPGPARFVEDVLQRIRDGISVAVATPLLVPTGLEGAFVEALAHDRWNVQRVTAELEEDPLRCLTERLYLEPEQWVGWNVERLFSGLSSGQVIVIDGVTSANWDSWRHFLRDFDVASRQRASDDRAVLLLFVRGVQQKCVDVTGGALITFLWSGLFGELDTLVYVDHRMRMRRKPTRHHKLIVRQIAALALWDLDLADHLVDQPEADIFDAELALRAGRTALGREAKPMQANWEAGGVDSIDGIKLLHPFVLLDQGDPSGELRRRLWAAQAAELLPLVEMRRRDLLQSLARHINCPFWIDGGKRQVRSLEDLEIGSLAYVTQKHDIRGDLRDRAEWLARCRNTLAHLGLLSGADALSPRWHV
ncbi:hypothetical protein [uncultured Pseudacidovorax sp.]|uniref:hypothetical protein n=1 Tax=uncultured Pseudacidovorax sp. TaxID=679313 RepID=UPI0025F9CA07|nr:hypothetical protein [uncultured Pseudacidovorax sp.]